FIVSPKPIKVKLSGTDPVVKNVKVSIGSADYLPTAEAPAAHNISVAATDGSCPALTVGNVTFDSASSVGVTGGKKVAGVLPLTIAPSQFTSRNAMSPARCVAVLDVSGPAGDADSSNDSTRLVIDVNDQNDY